MASVPSSPLVGVDIACLSNKGEKEKEEEEEGRETSITQKGRKRKRSRRIDFFGSFIHFPLFWPWRKDGTKKRVPPSPPFSP